MWFSRLHFCSSHIFQKQIRDYYEIEELWGDAKVISIES